MLHISMYYATNILTILLFVLYNNNGYMELKDIIKEYKLKTGMNDASIAKRLNISRSTVSRWRKGEVKAVSSDLLDKLSNLVGYNVAPLLKGMDTTITLPILGYVKGGYDLFAEENYIGEEDASMNDCKVGDYYLKVEGNSMSGVGIMDGSLVLVHQTSSLDNGDIGVVLINDEVTVKKVIFKDKMLILEAANPDIENRYFSQDEIKNLPVKIIGKVLSSKTYY